jgi:hypothetical protein
MKNEAALATVPYIEGRDPGDENEFQKFQLYPLPEMKVKTIVCEDGMRICYVPTDIFSGSNQDIALFIGDDKPSQSASLEQTATEEGYVVPICKPVTGDEHA